MTQDHFNEAVELVLRADLDTREEIEHHLQHLDAHYVAMDGKKVVGVIGWYQDNVHYADRAMGEKFPGEQAYWVGFFAVDPNYQKQGIGAALLRKLKEVMVRKGEKALWVSSVPETKTYYEQLGFRPVMEGEIGGNKKYFMMSTI